MEKEFTKYDMYDFAASYALQVIDELKGMKSVSVREFFETWKTQNHGTS